MHSGRLLAIGDIHACFKTFAELLSLVKLDKSDQCILMGDYIDRGPDSHAVLDLIMSLVGDGYNIIPLMGNHERMMQMANQSLIDLSLWENNGARKTMKSLNIKNPENIEKRYIDLIGTMPYFYKNDDYIFVHGGLNFKLDDPFSDTEFMLWARPGEIDLQKTDGRKLVVGHTPATIEVINESLGTDLIRLDGGCVYTNRLPVMGKLCCYDFTNKRLFYQNNIDE